MAIDTLAQLRAGKLAGTRRLNLACGLTTFPAEIYQLADSLEILDLSGNQLSTLPPDLGRLHKLRILFASNNCFTELPEVLGQCPQLSMIGFKSNQIRHIPPAALGRALRWLILTDNQLTELPEQIGQCRQLQKLMLAGNRLQSLPDTLANCRNLELLRISANHFSTLPAVLFSLPRLTWLAFGGNPLCAAQEQATLNTGAIPAVAWNRLQLQQQLGAGASGVIHQASWQDDTGSTRQVAVKLFKGSVTSDGLPHSEMAASLLAGRHPALIGLHGKLEQHPDNQAGLILALLDSRFISLAGPPSLESCTRDVYASETRFSLTTALKLAHAIAAAIVHLHEHGILHGDLYAHNILHDGEGECLLGDFGAASLLGQCNSEQIQALQRMEVRAFGYILEELLQRCDLDDPPDVAWQGLQQLKQACLHEAAAERPLFTHILGALARQCASILASPALP